MGIHVERAPGAQPPADHRAHARHRHSPATGRATPASAPSSTASPGMLWLCGHRGLRADDQPGDHLHGRRLRARRAAFATVGRPALPGRAPGEASWSSSPRARTSSTTSATSSSTASSGSSPSGGATATAWRAPRACTAAGARTSGWPSRSRDDEEWRALAVAHRPGGPGRRPAVRRPSRRAQAHHDELDDILAGGPRPGPCSTPSTSCSSWRRRPAPSSTTRCSQPIPICAPWLAAAAGQPRRRAPTSTRVCPTAASRRCGGAARRARRGQRVRLQGDAGRLRRRLRALPGGERILAEDYLDDRGEPY